MKRKTKQQKEDEARAALRQRIGDIYAAACHGCHDNEESWLLASDLPRVIVAVRDRLLGPDAKDYLTSSINADEYDTVESATDFLFRHGIRA